jgi:hypothetical protein
MFDSKIRMMRRIDDVLQSDLRPEIAYPLRARLGRAVLEIVRWRKSRNSSTRNSRIAEIVQRIEAASHHIMQPSEPFDSHWPQQWAEVLADLSQLRALIATEEDN